MSFFRERHGDRVVPEEHRIRGMFDRVAPRYDFVNRLMAANMDQRWRRRAARAARGSGVGPFLDVGAGTGDLSLALERAAPGARVLGVDLARNMLAIGRGKGATSVQASGIVVPARDATFEGVTNAFVLRNLSDLDAFFAEARRVLRPGGKLVSLEIGRPKGRLFGPLYRFYFYSLMPAVAGLLSSDKEAYRYLAVSVERVETPDQLVARMKKAGFATVTATPLMRGAVVLFEAMK